MICNLFFFLHPTGSLDKISDRIIKSGGGLDPFCDGMRCCRSNWPGLNLLEWWDAMLQKWLPWALFNQPSCSLFLYFCFSDSHFLQYNFLFLTCLEIKRLFECAADKRCNLNAIWWVRSGILILFLFLFLIFFFERLFVEPVSAFVNIDFFFMVVPPRCLNEWIRACIPTIRKRP